MGDATIPFATFRSLVATPPNEVRVQLAWGALSDLAAAGRVTVTAAPLLPDHDLGRLFAPWYRSAATGQVDWDTPGARPYSFAEIADDVSGLSAEHRASIAGIGRAFAASPVAPRFSVATYAVGDGRELVLDGNHRIAAVVRSTHLRERAVVTRMVLKAPVNPDLLPDLRHWSPARP